MGRRSVLLLAALVVAALGTTMVVLYVHGVNDRVLARQDPVRVVVAKKLIGPGTTYQDASDAASFEKKVISRDALVDKALGTTTGLAGQVTTTTIYPGEQIIPQMFGDAGNTSALAVPNGKTSISVQMDDPAQTAGFVTAGTNVAIFFTGAVAKAGGQEQTQLLLQAVEVLAIGDTTAVPLATTSGTEKDSVPKTILTLAVDQKDYQRVLFASTHGHLSLGLLGKGFAPSLTFPPTTQANLFD